MTIKQGYYSGWKQFKYNEEVVFVGFPKYKINSYKYAQLGYMREKPIVRMPDSRLFRIALRNGWTNRLKGIDVIYLPENWVLYEKRGNKSTR